MNMGPIFLFFAALSAFGVVVSALVEEFFLTGSFAGSALLFAFFYEVLKYLDSIETLLTKQAEKLEGRRPETPKEEENVK